MTPTDYSKMISQVLKDAVPVITSGVFTVALLSCVLFGIQTHLDLTPGFFGVGATVFRDGRVHGLFTHPFSHRSSAQLLLNIAALALLSGSLEKGVGTVRFLLLFLLLSTTTGLVYSFLALVQDGSSTEGLVPVALACVALTTMHTKMTKGFLCGVSFPTVALPWVFLVITTALIPHTVLPCNVIAVLIGWMCGKGWFSFLDISEARAGVLEKTMPLKWLRRIRGVKFIPASAEERRTALLPRINPTPGSYPVQAYAPLSSIKTADNAAMMYEGWPNPTGAFSGPTPPLHAHGHGLTHSFGLNHSHSCNHNHTAHSHGQL